MLWTVVVGAYLGVLRLTWIWLIPASIVTLWLVVILIARLCWGMRGGMVAVFSMAVVWGSVVVWKDWEALPILGSVVYFCIVWLIASVCGMLAYLLVSAVVHLVNWLDSTGRKQ